MLNATFRQRCELASEEGQRKLEASKKIEALQPVEIADATFYRRDEVDEILRLIVSK